MGDILSCAIGYIVGTLFAAVELWWLSIVWVVISEVSLNLFSPLLTISVIIKIICILYMRDSLLLAVVTLLVHSERLRQWQCAKIPKTADRYLFSRLCWWSARPKTC